MEVGMVSVCEQICLSGIVPVIKFNKAETAIPLAEILIKNNLPIAEVTFRTDNAEEALRRIALAFPNMLLGAGTVLTTEQIDRAIDAGAQFIVTPGFNTTTAEYCLKKQIPVFPGCNTPMAIEQALELGLTHLKFFPAEQSGGIAAIKALSGPYPMVQFMPTGGITVENLGTYLSNPHVFACGGSWMVKDELIDNKDYAKIETLVQHAVRETMGFTLKYIGINHKDSIAASQAAHKLAEFLMLPIHDAGVSLFVGTEFELLKEPYYGKNGHIAIGVYSVERVCAWLEKLGYHFKPDTYKYDARGRRTFAYMEEEISGFAIRFVNR